MSKIIYGFLLIIIIDFIRYTFRYIDPLLKYKEYIRKCRQKEFISLPFHREQENVFISISVPVYNMENYLESSLLSIIKQTFHSFEIILVNDNSNDNTENIIKKMQSKDKRIKCINHSKNLGVFASRADGILNAKGKYVLLFDPDDLILNQNLFKELYTYNAYYNLDIIEFLVYHQKEGNQTIFLPEDHKLSHYHNYTKQIIYQPELSNIIYYKPNSRNYSSIICRSIWNKLIRKEIMLNVIKYLNNDSFKDQFLIAADDTPLNMLAFEFANNYSNINSPGYLYNLREEGMSNDNKGNIKHDIILTYNFLLYFKFFYNYTIKYNKNIKFFLYDFKPFSVYLLKFKDLNVTEYIPMAVEFFKVIRKRKMPKKFRTFVDELITYFLK